MCVGGERSTSSQKVEASGGIGAGHQESKGNNIPPTAISADDHHLHHQHHAPPPLPPAHSSHRHPHSRHSEEYSQRETLPISISPTTPSVSSPLLPPTPSSLAATSAVAESQPPPLPPKRTDSASRSRSRSRSRGHDSTSHQLNRGGSERERERFSSSDVDGVFTTSGPHQQPPHETQFHHQAPPVSASAPSNLASG